MSNQKLSPRQRMINMMYLVLIAMLALNVSREILKSFHLFELSFINANHTADNRNHEIMNSFQAKMDSAKTRAKTEKWYLLAKDARRLSDEFTNYVEQLKVEIIREGGGRLEPEEKQNGVTELSKPDDLEHHAYYFSDNGKANGRKLKLKINETREKLLDLVIASRNGNAVRSSLSRSTQLRAVDPKSTGSEIKTWENIYLESAPLAGVVTLLTKTQSDCKALEADVLNVLSENININTVIHDGQMAVIIPDSRYVMSGSDFRAKIALATFDKTSPQKIMVNGQPITLNGGLGEYTFPANGTSSHTVEAKIETINPLTGETIYVKADPIEWSSFQPSATIAADAMNVLFVGLDNPMSISVPGVTPENTLVTASNGVTLSKNGSGKFIARANGTSNSSVISVSARMQDGTIKKMGANTYRVRMVPHPKLKLGNLSSGVYPKGKLMLQTSVNAVLENFYFNDVRFTVMRYKAILVSARNGYIEKEGISGDPTSFRWVLQQAKPGETVYIDYVRVKGPGSEMLLDPISLKIQ